VVNPQTLTEIIKVEEQTADRLKALWKSGRDKYRSFFTVLEEVRKEIGDEALPMWCIKELRIGFSTITTVAGVLTKAETLRVKSELAEAKKAAARAKKKN
jgi:hypothetical protein